MTITAQSTTIAATNRPNTTANVESSIASHATTPSSRAAAVTRRLHTRWVRAVTIPPRGVVPAAELVAGLRGTRGLRPRADRSLAGGLRAWLEDGIFELFGDDDVPPGGLRLVAADVAPGPGAAGSVAVLRGALLAQLLVLRVAGAANGSPLEDASAALRGSGRDAELAASLDALDRDDLARLRSEVTAHASVLATALGELPTRWSPRRAPRCSIQLAGGRVVCGGRADLALGSRGGSHAAVCLVDLTTSPLEARHDVLCRYLALLETLRSGEPPLRVAVLSTADGLALLRDVDATMLGEGVVDVLDALSCAVHA